MNKIFSLSVCFYIIQNQGYSIKCLIKKFPAMLEREIWGKYFRRLGYFHTYYFRNNCFDEVNIILQQKSTQSIYHPYQ